MKKSLPRTFVQDNNVTYGLNKEGLPESFRTKVRGLFITFEGIDGSGKSTHSKLLTEYLRKKGYQVIHTREPGGVSIAESLRKILLHPAPARKGGVHPKIEISPYCELLLYLAARAQHVEELIRPSLKRSTMVSKSESLTVNRKPLIIICERFSDATSAYQGYGRGISLRLIKKLDTITTKGLKPDLTILLDLPVVKRKTLAPTVSGDRLENEPLQFHQRVRRGYLKLAEKEPKRFRVIKVKRTISQTQKEIRQILIHEFNQMKEFTNVRE